MKPTAYLSVGLLVLVLAGFDLQGWSSPEPAAGPLYASVELPVPSGDVSGSQPVTLDPVARPAPPAPLRVALQAGHWRASEAPDELSGLRTNGGTKGGGKNEWEINLEIAELTGALLEEAGYAVEILPATVPQGYRSDVFVAIHADGNNDPSVRGYRVGSPRRDRTQRAGEFAEVLANAYGEATGIRRLPVATRRMRGYYAFRYNRYRHAIHPLTVGVIIETGFLTNATDRRVIVEDQNLAAKGIFEGITRFLGSPTATVATEPPFPSLRTD